MFTRYLIVLALLTGCLSGMTAASGTDAGRHVLAYGGVERGYLLRLPSGTPVGARLPLVLVLHGGGGNAANAERMTGFTDKAMRESFIVVYPEGSGRLKGRLLTWNAGHCCGYAMDRKVDDVGFIATLIDRLVAEYPVDPDRVFVTGMSNGGMMTHRLGIELADRVAAIAPVVATLFGNERVPSRPVSALMINGLLDQSVPHLGGVPGGRFPGAWDGMATRPALDQVDFWAAADGCETPCPRRDSGPASQWLCACPAGSGVELYLVKDNGHAWPGGERGSWRGDKPSTALNATDLIWAFFHSHGRHRDGRTGTERPAQ